MLLHVGACDYHTEVWVNGRSAGEHIGGYVSFSFDITDLLKDGENVLVICADDHIRSGCQPAGKQSSSYASAYCFYTRTTGIWQTVWLEWVPDAYIRSLKCTPSLEEGRAVCGSGMRRCPWAGAYHGGFPGGKGHGKTNRYSQRHPGQGIYTAGTGIPWCPESPVLYDLQLVLGEDRVESYFGMRSIVFRDRKFYLNGQPVFQRLVLDQGFYPDGIYTAPTDGELIGDIRRSLDMGFNGARLHEKNIRTPLFISLRSDGLSGMGRAWELGLDLSRPEAWRGFLPEWLEAVQRDYHHPAIVGWCPLNETQENQDPYLVRMLYDMTKSDRPHPSGHRRFRLDPCMLRYCGLS